MELQGLLKHIYPENKISDKFSIKEFVVTVSETQYPQYIVLQLSGDRIDLLDPYKVGDEIKVHFNLRGRIWTNPQGEEKYFNSLHAWRIECINKHSDNSQAEQQSDLYIPIGVMPENAYNPEDNDLPF